MNVLFINPRYDERQYRYKVNKLCPPLGMAYLASILRSRGHCPTIIDMEAVQMEWDDLAPAIARTRADVVGIHGTTPICTYIARAADAARQALPDATIIVGGPHATLLPEAVPNDMPQVDYLLRGEGEQTLPELLDRLQQGAGDGELEDIAGIGLRDGGRLVISPQFGERATWTPCPCPPTTCCRWRPTSRAAGSPKPAPRARSSP